MVLAVMALFDCMMFAPERCLRGMYFSLNILLMIDRACRGVNDGFKVNTQTHLAPVLASIIKVRSASAQVLSLAYFGIDTVIYSRRIKALNSLIMYREVFKILKHSISGILGKVEK